MNLSELTTLQIGGPAKNVIVVNSEDQLVKAFTNLSHITSHISPLIIGSGSNLLVSDKGYDGVVIKNEISTIEQAGNSLKVKSGTILQDLVDFANSKGLSGLQNLAGIPGTVGGAIYGNAGAYGQTITDHLTRVKVLLNNLEIEQFSHSQCSFTYRSSIFKKTKDIILEAEFELTPANSDQLIAESIETIKKRLIKYPPGIKCPGSFFKNIVADTLPKEILDKIPQEFTMFNKVLAGALLESVGAKGKAKGHIKVAPYHANLFINNGGGKASDFYTLAKTYSQKVFEKYGIKLEPEVQLINLPPL